MAASEPNVKESGAGAGEARPVASLMTHSAHECLASGREVRCREAGCAVQVRSVMAMRRY